MLSYRREVHLRDGDEVGVVISTMLKLAIPARVMDHAVVEQGMNGRGVLIKGAQKALAPATL